MDPKRITQATDVLAILEDGEFAHEATNEIQTVLAKLRDMAPPKGKGVKGSVTIKLAFDVTGNQVEIAAALESKTPKATRGRSFFFVRPDGALSTEHPSQMAMFDGPKVVGGQQAG